MPARIEIDLPERRLDEVDDVRWREPLRRCRARHHPENVRTVAFGEQRQGTVDRRMRRDVVFASDGCRGEAHISLALARADGRVRLEPWQPFPVRERGFRLEQELAAPDCVLHSRTRITRSGRVLALDLLGEVRQGGRRHRRRSRARCPRSANTTASVMRTTGPSMSSSSVRRSAS
jgi:hypothetical protein